MNVHSKVFATILCLAFSGHASSQVYESKDADGSTVFSDKPSAGSKAVEIPPTNSAGPVPDIPKPTTPTTTPATNRQQEGNPAPGTQRADGNDDDYIYYPGGAVNSDQAEQRREELQERREEGAGTPGREPPVQVQPHRKVARPAGGGGGRR